MRYVLLLLSCLTLTAMASPFRVVSGTMDLAQEVGAPATKAFVPEVRGPRFGDQQAAARVRRVYADHKILSIQLIETRGPPVYRIKTLSEKGVVKYVFVDGTSGDVFE